MSGSAPGDGVMWIGPAIPGKAGVAGMALRAPGLVGGELLPMGVVEAGRGPRRVVADVKLPRAVERRRAFAEAVNDQRMRAGSGGSLRLSGNGQHAGSEGKDKKAQAGKVGSSRRHAANIQRARRVKTHDFLEGRGAAFEPAPAF